MIYLQLFLSFLQVGMFSVGGGYAAMPLIQSQVVEQHGWLTMQEFTDLITIAEMTPGPLSNFCRSAYCTGSRSHYRNSGLYHTRPVLCFTAVIHLPQIQGYFSAAKRSCLPAPGHCSTDFWGRAFHPVYGSIRR